MAVPIGGAADEFPSAGGGTAPDVETTLASLTLLDYTQPHEVAHGLFVVDRFDVAADGRAISGRQVAVDRGARATGWPDGMTVDADGYLWVCLWDGWAVERYSPDGRLDQRIALPVAQVTSCAFGGPNLEELYITTAREGFPAGGRHDQQHAGSIFRVRPGVRGRRSFRFPGRGVAAATEPSSR